MKAGSCQASFLIWQGEIALLQRFSGTRAAVARGCHFPFFRALLTILRAATLHLFLVDDTSIAHRGKPQFLLLLLLSSRRQCRRVSSEMLSPWPPLGHGARTSGKRDHGPCSPMANLATDWTTVDLDATKIPSPSIPHRHVRERETKQKSGGHRMIECPSCRVSAHPGIWENW